MIDEFFDCFYDLECYDDFDVVIEGEKYMIVGMWIDGFDFSEVKL